jgi:hypothetical protein
MIVGHVMGLPVEETVLQAVVVGATTGTAVGIAGRIMLGRILTRPRRRLRCRLQDAGLRPVSIGNDRSIQAEPFRNRL